MVIASPRWLVGAGNMGGALLGRWLAAGIAGWQILDPAMQTPPAGCALGAGAQPPALLVLAVKPQLWRQVVDGLAVQDGAIVVSVMAGVPMAALAEAFPNASIVRAMPNTPAAIGAGVSGLCGPQSARPAMEALFGAAGSVHWLEAEAQFDALTAVSGSGPAYVFHFIEALAAAGEAQGLAPALAMALARDTVTGAAALAVADPASAEALRTRVTSPGGTTAAGLSVLMPGLPSLLAATIEAAARRSRELAG